MWGRYSNSGQPLCLWLKYVIRWRANSLEKRTECFYLEYEKMSLLTGEYYFDIAFFEEHATVPLVYKTKYVTMFITGRYAGEGIVILDHKWKDTTKDEV